MTTHRDLLSLWPDLPTLVDDLKAEGVEIGLSGVGMWKTRDDIPSHYWPALVRIAATRGLALTLETLVSSQKRLREGAA